MLLKFLQGYHTCLSKSGHANLLESASHVRAPVSCCEHTARYLHVADSTIRDTRSPLELLDSLDLVHPARIASRCS
jgi:hypothetical protein